MIGCCHDDSCSSQRDGGESGWRRALWIALVVNGGMFFGEIGAGLAAGSASLQADAIDFLADTANYVISLGVAGLALHWRARAALLKGFSLALLGIIVLASTVWHAIAGTIPDARTIGLVGMLALFANAGVALMLYRFRSGDSNMRSVWICSRNDAIGNLAVLVASAGVLGTGTAWPDLIVASVMAALSVTGGYHVIRRACIELRAIAPPSVQLISS